MSHTAYSSVPRRGFFESLVSPIRSIGSSPAWQKNGGDESLPSLGVPLTHVVYFVMLPLALFFVFFQGYLGYRTFILSSAAVPARLASPMPANATFLQELEADLRKSGRLGYVEATIPESVVNFLAEAERELEALDDAEADLSEEAVVQFTVESEAGNYRLTPMRKLGPKVSKPFPARPPYTKKEAFELTWDYDMDEKEPPYVGNSFWMNQFDKSSRAYFNSLATFPFPSNEKPYRYHGLVGVYPNGTQAWNPAPMPPAVKDAPQGRAEAMKRGGFYLDLANALPMDREPDDNREEICKQVVYNYSELGDASVVITFYNEPISTLLRSVHSVLNQTPPPLLREIILVDDHSNLTENLPGNDLYEHIRLLPKVKLMRLPERRGLVWARLAGAQAAKSDVLVVLDSHIEVNRGWLEPQLQRLVESPKSVVYPQIFALDAEDFSYHKYSGIGCWLSWKWNMVEQASLTPALNNTDPISSASMAGGLFAVRLDWFWEIGGYDEEFAMWGSENVEMGFRVWQCGGRMECTPCSRTYHIYRKDGIGYSSPGESVQRNKLRTARVWMDEWYQITMKFLGNLKADMGNLDNILALKEKLKCKSFKWFLDNVDPGHEANSFDQIQIFGEIRNVKFNMLCVDLIHGPKHNVTYGQFHCHGSDGTQGFFKVSTHKKIKSFLDETKCLSNYQGLPYVWNCHDYTSDAWAVEDQHLIYAKGQNNEACLAIEEEENNNKVLRFSKCDMSNDTQKWTMKAFVPDPNYAPPDFSIQYKKIHGLIDTSQD
eukprot:Gregarina_sp_Poly_1__9714@NODE_617_length_7122_cov_220_571368_g473_i0_p1_GENE_NODE_617_length_7122_cov_220_571368_g473_i0NODE_617_length_7122_cov_220_571368_g473_i0_p1_ORF_typecomplete_len773_score111_90Glycos_transf_2/PF00535_26/2_1e23Glyco_tranf_2_3/PF13641_6/2_5e22Glyco_transf_7C/PF02709_14/6_8e15Glyco_tranf_2_2/PF10111_9/1e11Ricin_B_lectin/PF00652_22/1_1e11Glyco_transf_21/PF13506_6/2_5e05CDtoxinA/PF03498_14/63CDtoxinA/PF03498_14/1_8_NODE_617_length_7122_cov_220_571368_g473_i044046722